MIVVTTNFVELQREARQRAIQMVNNGLYSRFGLDYRERVDKALLGCMGELAFEAVLQQRQIPYQRDEADFLLRNTDEYDFLIAGHKVDVKVAKKSTHRPPADSWTYGYPQDQRPQSKDYVVVGWIDFRSTEVGFYGWITGKKISQYEVVTHNSFAGYSYLTPNHEFKWGAMNRDFEQLFSVRLKG